MAAVLLTAKGRKICEFAAALAQAHLPDIEIIRLRRGEPPDCFEALGFSRLDAILSFLCPAVVPGYVLARSPLNVNFHPGSADYPGIGCYNFALYEEAPKFGACCHFMEPAVDTGGIIYEERFPILPNDTVETLQLKTWSVLLELFSRFVREYAQGQEFRAVGQWTREPFTRRQLDDIATITPGMDEAEIARRIRATSYPGYAPQILVNGERLFVSRASEETIPLVERVFL